MSLEPTVAWFVSPALAPMAARAQPREDEGAVRLSIEEALRLAEQASESVTIARAGVQRSDAQRLQARSEWLPKINGLLTYDRLLKSEYEGLFDPPDPGAGDRTASTGGRARAFRLR